MILTLDSFGSWPTNPLLNIEKCGEECSCGVGWPGGKLVGGINGGLLRLRPPPSTSRDPTCRLVASQSSQQGRRIWTNKDQPQGSGSGLRTRIRPTIRIRIEDQELDQADLNCRIKACDHLKGQFERSRSWLLLCEMTLVPTAAKPSDQWYVWRWDLSCVNRWKESSSV